MASCTEIFHRLQVIKLLSQKLNDIKLNTVTVIQPFWMDSDCKFSFITLLRELLKRRLQFGLKFAGWETQTMKGEGESLEWIVMTQGKKDQNRASAVPFPS